MKKQYTSPAIKVIPVRPTDIIATSLPMNSFEAQQGSIEDMDEVW